MSIPKIIFILPCFNEEEILHDTISKMETVLKGLISQKKIDEDSSIVFVDDGSTDSSWKMISENMTFKPFVKGLKLSRNFGHQLAIFAGMMEMKDSCDAIITLDADLQDDLDVISIMIDKFNKGNEIVYGVPQKRISESFLKRKPAQIYYKLLRLMGVDIVANHADFRLVSKKAAGILSKFKERNIFLRGIFPLMGLKSDKVEYDKAKRIGGKPKYSIFKLCCLAFSGITAFSYTPLRYITFFGFLVTIGSFIYMLYVLIAKTMGHIIPGWTSLILSIYFLGGVQIFFMGIIGEYIARIYSEVKHRPRYIIEENKANG
ncbi:MAG: glycosyltransferase family 2 protein [Candidatus Omnitrophica bacterium]|nr:glycosyltransferase family 2 protein [Candidatus Omnitrophota bacterium]